MLSVKRIIPIILIVVIVGAIFVAGSLMLDQSMPFQASPDGRGSVNSQTMMDDNKPTIRLMGDESDDESAAISANVEQMCEYLQLPVSKDDEFDRSQMSESDIVVFCDPHVDELASTEELSKFIADGGRAILAAGIAQPGGYSNNLPLFGIARLTEGYDCDELTFNERVLPVQPDKVRFPAVSGTGRLMLEPEATVYAEDAEGGNPILFSFDWKGGSSFVINGSFLSDARYMGLFTSALCMVSSDFVYPVLGIKCLFLDDFPAISQANDELCDQLYGYTTEAFVEQVLWSSLQGMSLRSQTPFTGSLLVEAPSQSAFEKNGSQTFFETGKSLLKFDGELAFAAECDAEGDLDVDRERLQRFADEFPSYTVRGLAIESGEPSSKAADIEGTDIACMRGASDDGLRFSWEDGITFLPTATSGANVKEGDLLAMCTVLGAYGMVSHSLDVNELTFGVDGNEAAWNDAKFEVGAIESDVLSQAVWLRGTTLSQAAGDIQSYLSLGYGWDVSDDELRIVCSNAIEGQAFLYHTNKQVVNFEGIDVVDVGNGYYFLRVQSGSSSLKLKGGE